MHRPEGSETGARSELTDLGRIWFGAVVAVSVVLVLATGANAFSDGTGLLGYILPKLDLSLESNPAAAWSGMLLALTSVHAFDGYASERTRNPKLARGWALIALVLLALSADEIGSLHERAGTLGLGSWWPLLPFALILGTMMSRGLILLWRSLGSHQVVLQLVIGFILMGSVAVQEFVEHRIVLTSAAGNALRAGLEEGSEILGMLVVLQVTMRNTSGVAGHGGDVALEAVRQLRPPSPHLGPRPCAVDGISHLAVSGLSASRPPG